MRITIVSIGSRGDVQPFVALGGRLRRDGHQVRLATHSNFKDWIESFGLEFFPIAGNPEEILATEKGWRFVESDTNAFAYISRWFGEILSPIIRDIIIDSWNASEGCDIVIGSGSAAWAADVALGRGVPFFYAPLWPVHPSRYYLPYACSQTLRVGKVGNLLLHNALGLYAWRYLRKAVNEVRTQKMGLRSTLIPEIAAAGGRSVRTIVGVSRHLFPKPPDWGPQLEITGPWFLSTPESYSLPPEVEDFLAAGPPPVCVGFGSMTTRNPRKMTGIVLDALRRLGQRGILITGWGALVGEQLPRDVISVESIPHDRLFPRVSAVVSAGSAGATWATLRAGVPPVTVPFCGDQWFWAHRVSALRLGPPPISANHVTESTLANAINIAVTDQAIRTNVKVLGEKVRAEDGLENALRFIYAHLPAQLRAKAEGSAANAIPASEPR